ncbi:MAG: CRISPR-associated protein, Cse4 family [Hydrogenibacillus schlegelii]|uniref:CRISPR-associated protein, Cse4 family n=1 Tax=Hydrogenibacillus schlegelii TaxID=1484 RepID=A0A2T5G9E3_HYDSH|nr:type I-E CRISPR-associated protein Cas7/Cse4/CasC [Hydrogenibacillus schlegelii]PTQ52812.1 MAG: CRISPR-associated protein, Cse4 family [Hydrogenibacillus schlegelii]
MFLQVHYLTSYHASLLNRDDTGLAKRIRFGGAERLRISSQAQKKHWRDWMMQVTSLPSAIRSRHFFSRVIKHELVREGMDDALAHELAYYLAQEVLRASGEKDALDSKTTLAMKQPVLFGRPEAEYFKKLIREAAAQGSEEDAKKYLTEAIKESKSNIQSMLRQAGLGNPAVGFEGALFGRFVTSDILARVDAPVHVAHAFTTHELRTEIDFFTVVDDLAADEETGAAHAGDMELGAGIFYGYVAVDVPLLVSNLGGRDRKEWREDPDGQAMARELLGLLIQAIATVTPGAKLGATAPYARAEFVLLEAGEALPRSLANAFLEPVPLDGNANGLARSVDRLSEYLTKLEGMYGDSGETRYVASLHPWPRQREQKSDLSTAIEGTLRAIFEAGEGAGEGA